MKASFVILGIFIAIFGVGIWLGWQYVMHDTPVNIMQLNNPDCLLNETACEAVDNQGRTIQLSFSPRPVPLMQAVQVKLQIPNFLLSAAPSLLIEGVNMSMGFQRVVLQRSTQDTIPTFIANTTLPLCSESVMHWQVTATLPTNAEPIYARFNLTTQR